MKKKIWILNHHANSMYFDMGGRHYNFAKYLKRAGYEPTIFCSNAEHGTGKKYFANAGIAQEHMAEKIGVPFVFIKGRGYTDNGIKRVLCMFDYYINVKKYAQRYAKINGKPDVIIGSSVHPLACVAGIKLARKFKVPCIAEIRDLWPESLIAYGIATRKHPLVLYFRYIEKWIYKYSDRIVFSMEGAYDYIKEQGWDKGIPKSKVFYVNNGVDLEQFDYNCEHYKLKDIDLDDDSIFKVIYTGSIRKVNKLDKLLNIAKQIDAPNIRFLIWGDGEQLQNLKNRVQNEGITNVIFKGRVEKRYISYITKKSDLNIAHSEVSSILRFGISSNKIFDYLAAGRPILCDFPSKYNPVIMLKAGISVDSGDEKEIARTIEKIEKSNDRFEYALNARKGVEKYDLKYLTSRLIEIIEQI